MTDLSAEYKALSEYRPIHKPRFVTAASLFDGHDAAINIMRRILQSMGAEVIHLGHNRSVEEVVTAALQEDVQAIAVSSYQGGHVEYFKYMVELLRQRGGSQVKVFGGGGGVIVPAEIQELQASGVSRIYSPEDGQRMGLAGMIGEMLMMSDCDLSQHAPQQISAIRGRGARRALAQLITALEGDKVAPALRAELDDAAKRVRTPVVGITGTGGAGKSSLTDELIRAASRGATYLSPSVSESVQTPPSSVHSWLPVPARFAHSTWKSHPSASPCRAGTVLARP